MNKNFVFSVVLAVVFAVLFFATIWTTSYWMNVYESGDWRNFPTITTGVVLTIFFGVCALVAIGAAFDNAD